MSTAPGWPRRSPCARRRGRPAHGDTIHLTPRADQIHRFDAEGAADRMMRLAGKTALITGPAAASAWPSPRPMCAKGARVAIADIDIDRARAPPPRSATPPSRSRWT
jgi:hypothetical protein